MFESYAVKAKVLVLVLLALVLLWYFFNRDDDDDQGSGFGVGGVLSSISQMAGGDPPSSKTDDLIARISSKQKKTMGVPCV